MVTLLSVSCGNGGDTLTTDDTYTVTIISESEDIIKPTRKSFQFKKDTHNPETIAFSCDEYHTINSAHSSVVDAADLSVEPDTNELIVTPRQNCNFNVIVDAKVITYMVHFIPDSSCAIEGHKAEEQVDIEAPKGKRRGDIT